VILKRHAREMTDLDAAERAALMRIVFALERAAREAMHPHKMNVASLGNMVPARALARDPALRGRPTFPGPVWAAPQRTAVVPEERRKHAEGIVRLSSKALEAP
jgi:diadenosine tetraphosphate (Ap4A) HIT family hydrolase